MNGQIVPKRSDSISYINSSDLRNGLGNGLCKIPAHCKRSVIFNFCICSIIP